MKKILFVSLAAFLSNICLAQGTAKPTTGAANNPHLKVFKQATNIGDVTTAISALNYYIAEQTASSNYEDTLAMLYMQQDSYIQCYYWADKRSKLKPDDLVLLELKGICLDKLNQPKEAITAYEKLFTKTQSPFHAYTLMQLQYSIKRLAECMVTASAAEKLVFKPEYVIPYSIGEQNGRTYLQAGVYNIMGLAYYDLDKKTESKMYFEKALALDSNFVLAKQNLEAIKSLESGGKVNGAGNSNPSSPANKND